MKGPENTNNNPLGFPLSFATMGPKFAWGPGLGMGNVVKFTVFAQQ